MTEMLQLTTVSARASLSRLCQRKEATLIMHQRASSSPASAVPLAFIVPVSVVPRLKLSTLKRELLPIRVVKSKKKKAAKAKAKAA